MKGNMKLRVEFTDETRSFPITETWEYTTDNTYEGLDQWLELFEKILVTQGFHPYKLKVMEDEDEEG